MTVLKKTGDPQRASQSSEDDDEELGQYSDKVQKRLNKLKFDYHEERRQRESAERMREEAVKVAQQYASKAQEQESLITRGEAALVDQIRERAQLHLAQAKEGYRKAYEEGDTDGVVNTQEQMLRAQSEISDIEKYKNNLNLKLRMLKLINNKLISRILLEELLKM